MAATSSRLIIGLGNPGAEYEGTRHNIGFAVVDAVAARRSVVFGSEQPGAARWLNALIGNTNAYDEGWGKWRGRSFGLVKPMTYMNRSGGALAYAMISMSSRRRSGSAEETSRTSNFRSP